QGGNPDGDFNSGSLKKHDRTSFGKVVIELMARLYKLSCLLLSIKYMSSQENFGCFAKTIGCAKNKGVLK
ncbi:MAG: hypothetical protein Q7U40_14120, partial [Desulfatirhabdiaceae bacterium]|nr:hypothetical protein [Desulfatirhabdiaceae bacterium]